MIAHNMFFHHLKSFGLNNYESKIWVTLLSKGSASASDLSELSGVPRSRTYDVLESLEKKGFVITKIGKPVQYLAIGPERAIERVKSNIKKESEERLDFIDKITDDNLFSQLNEIYDNGISTVDQKNICGIVIGRKAVYQKIDEVITNSDKTLVFSTTSNGLIRKHKAFGTGLKRAATKGVTIDFFIYGAIPSIFSKEKHITLHPSLHQGRFVLSEKEVIIFFEKESEVESHNDKALWITSPFLAQTFSLLQKNK